MQRPGANNPPERPLLSAETGNSQIEGKNPRRNGLFLIGDGFRGSGRLVGGGSSPAKPVSNAEFPGNRAITGNFSEFGLLRVLVERRNVLAIAVSA
jgi:hypothetical protein